MKRYTDNKEVPQAESSKTTFRVQESVELLTFLAQCFPDMNRTRLKNLLAYCVCVDGHRTSQYNYPLVRGMEVSIVKADYRRRFSNREYDIVYEDPHLIVVNKHEGLISYSKKPSDTTLISLVNRYFERTHQSCHAHVVHRLDRDTSGLMIVAKSKEVARLFEENWKERVYDRAYVAVVWGTIEPQQGSITSYLTDGQYCVLSSPVDNGGKLATTHYRTLQSRHPYSLVELRLDTGRRNQIRVHMRELKHPVVHDPMYGYKEDQAPIARLALHAYRLCFIHPVTGRKHEFETPVPSSFLRLVQQDVQPHAGRKEHSNTTPSETKHTHRS